MDRARLSGMFNLVDQHDIVFGTDNPNDVTRQELDELADLYSNIREGNSHIKIANRSRAPEGAVTADSLSEDEFGAFQSETLADLARILQTREGRTVLKSLGAGGKTGASDFTIGGVANPRQSTAILGNDTTASNRTGSGASVYYRPGQDLDAVLKSGPLTSTSDTMLFHELVHAYHAGQGEIIPRGETLGLLESIEKGVVHDAGVPREEYATVGLGEFAQGAITENAYRASHRLLAGGDLTRKDKYKERTTYN